MKRVKTVRAGWRAASRAMPGRIACAQGTAQGDPGPNRRCMSTHRWTAAAIGSSWCSRPIPIPVRVPIPVAVRVPVRSPIRVGRAFAAVVAPGGIAAAGLLGVVVALPVRVQPVVPGGVDLLLALVDHPPGGHARAIAGAGRQGGVGGRLVG